MKKKKIIYIAMMLPLTAILVGFLVCNIKFIKDFGIHLIMGLVFIGSILSFLSGLSGLLDNLN